MSPDGGGKGSARREPAGDKNFARSKPPRAGPEETEQSKKERTAPPRLPPGGAPTRAGRLAGPRLLLLFLFLVPGRVPRSEEPGEAVPGGAAPPAAAGHVPPERPRCPRAPTRRWPERGWPQPWPAVCSRSRHGPPARLLQPGRHERSPCDSSSRPRPEQPAPREEPATATAPPPAASRSGWSSLWMLGSCFPPKPPQPVVHLVLRTVTVNAVSPRPC